MYVVILGEKRQNHHFDEKMTVISATVSSFVCGILVTITRDYAHSYTHSSEVQDFPKDVTSMWFSGRDTACRLYCIVRDTYKTARINVINLGPWI